MMSQNLGMIIERHRLTSPAPAPQALAWHEERLWMGSRDLRRLYQIKLPHGGIVDEHDAPGIPWAAVSTGDALSVTSGEGPEDDRYIRQYTPGKGFSQSEPIPCPDFTGSYLSYDGKNLYLSQWYRHRILKLDRDGRIQQIFDVGAEVSGHTFLEGSIYVLRGTEQGDESWRIARFNVAKSSAEVEDLAKVPFACRSLTFDGTCFWANHRAANEIVGFVLPT